jgi:hypothetical protein
MPGDIVTALLEAGLVTESQARAANATNGSSSGADVVERLVDAGLDERVLAGFFVSRGFGPMLQSAELARADVELIRRLTASDARSLVAMPLRPSAAGAVVAMADPTDEDAVARLSEVFGGRILPTVARLSDLKAAIDRHFPPGSVGPVADSARPERGRAPSGVMPLVQEKALAADETVDGSPAPDFASTASPVWDRAWSRSNTEPEVSLTPQVSRMPSHMPVPSIVAPSVRAPAVSESAIDAHLVELAEVGSRDEAVLAACEACAATSRGAAFLALRKGVFRGWDGVGDEVTSAAIRSLWVPASNPSMLNEVLHSGKVFRGPYGDTAADHLFRAAFGTHGRDVAICPVQVGSRMVGVLCVNDPPVETDTLERVAEALGQAFQRLIVARKTSG